MKIFVRAVRVVVAGAFLLPAWAAAPGLAQGCRAKQIMTSQCTWFALDELGADKKASAQAENEATSALVGGCSQGEYQMVLLRGTGLADGVVTRLRARGARDAAAVRAECAAAAGRVAGR
jgi:hypothetical protein